MTRRIIEPFQLASAQSLAANFQSSPTNIQHLDKIAYKVTTSGVTDNTGTFGVQVRDNGLSLNGVPGDWIDLSFDSVPTLNDTDGDFYIEATVVATEARLTFAAAGGTPDGTARILVSGTQIGG